MVVWMPWSKLQHGLFQPVSQATLKQLHNVTPLHHLNDDNKKKYQRSIHTQHNSNIVKSRSLSPVNNLHTTTTQQQQTTQTVQQSTDSTLIQVPYNIHRTSSKQLPVYTDYRRGNHIQTILRRVTGDQNALYNEIRLLLGPHVHVESRQGKIVIDGQHTHVLKQWLEKLGF